MNQLVIDASTILPLLWAFFAGVILGGIYSFSLGRRKGIQEALQQRNREDTARVFAEYLNNLSKGARRDGSTTT